MSDVSIPISHTCLRSRARLNCHVKQISRYVDCSSASACSHPLYWILVNTHAIKSSQI
jgi:hypothetical protein